MTGELEIKKSRRCPFYGLMLAGSSIMIDTGGNVCALGNGRYTPGPCNDTNYCGNWGECQHYNNPKTLAIIAELKDTVKVFPSEQLDLLGGGIQLRQWLDMVALNQE